MNLDKFTIDFSDQFEDRDRELITVDTDFKELEGWDSLTIMLIIGMIKTEYEKDITATQIQECTSVKELYEFVKSI